MKLWKMYPPHSLLGRALQRVSINNAAVNILAHGPFRTHVRVLWGASPWVELQYYGVCGHLTELSSVWLCPSIAAPNITHLQNTGLLFPLYLCHLPDFCQSNRRKWHLAAWICISLISCESEHPSFRLHSLWSLLSCESPAHILCLLFHWSYCLCSYWFAGVACVF